MLRTINRFIRHRGGATAVEVGIIFPVFLVMVIGIIEVGRAMWIRNTMQFAVEEATRYAMVNISVSTTALETYAQTKLEDLGVSSTGVTFTATQDTTGGQNFVTISASFTFEVLVPLVPLPDMTLSASSRVPLISS